MAGDLHLEPAHAQPDPRQNRTARTRPPILRTTTDPVNHNDHDNGQGGGYGFFRHAHPFPSPPMSPTARSISSPRSPYREEVVETAPMLAESPGNGMVDDDTDLEKPLTHRMQLAGLCILNCFMVFPNSLIGPLLPKLAHDCGISMTSTGFILAMFSIAIFVTGPIITSATKNIDPKLTTITGCVLLTVFTIAFAFVNRFRGSQFLVISALIRFLQGVGGSAYSCGSSLLILKLFPDHIAVTSGMLEVSASTGYLIGPALGNVLYKRGGFSIPFLGRTRPVTLAFVVAQQPDCLRFIGVGVTALLSIIPVSMMNLSTTEVLGADADSQADAEIVSAMDVIRVRNVVAILILNTLSMSVLGLQELAINPIFAAIGANVDQVAFAFVLNSIVYGLSSGICGWVNARRPLSGAIVLLLGSLTMGMGLVGFAGSAPILIPETLTMKCLFLSILMVGFAMSQNPVLPLLVAQTRHLGPGYEHALSGVLVSSVGFGEIVGPIVAGLLFDTIGLPLGAGLISLAIAALAAAVYWQSNMDRASITPNTNEKCSSQDDTAGLTTPLMAPATATSTDHQASE